MESDQIIIIGFMLICIIVLSGLFGYTISDNLTNIRFTTDEHTHKVMKEVGKLTMYECNVEILELKLKHQKEIFDLEKYYASGDNE